MQDAPNWGRKPTFASRRCVCVRCHPAPWTSVYRRLNARFTWVYSVDFAGSRCVIRSSARPGGFEPPTCGFSLPRGFPRAWTISSPQRWDAGVPGASEGGHRDGCPIRCGVIAGVAHPLASTPSADWMIRRSSTPSTARLGITRVLVGCTRSCGLPRVHPVRLPPLPTGAPLRVIKKETAALSY